MALMNVLAHTPILRRKRRRINPEEIKQGYRTLFMSTQGLLAILAKAHGENKLEERLRALCQPKLLIIDEIGYLPLDRHGASLFFQLIARRYEKGALILTSNQTYSHWGEVFGDHVLATAILDRLLHHAVSVSIKGVMCQQFPGQIVKRHFVFFHSLQVINNRLLNGF